MEIQLVWWWWVITAGVFLIIELMTTTFFGLWMAIAALVPGILSLFISDISPSIQIAVWVVSILLCAYAWAKRNKKTFPDVYDDPIVGQIGLVIRKCTAETAGVIALQKPVKGKTEWPCLSASPLMHSTRVVVKQIQNDGILLVEPTGTIASEQEIQ